MPVLEHNDITFEAGSIEFRNALQDRLSVILREMATERARADGRDVVTRDDFRACIQDAVDVAIKELLPPR